MSRRTRVLIVLALAAWTLSAVPERVQEQRRSVAELAAERGAASAGGAVLAAITEIPVPTCTGPATGDYASVVAAVRSCRAVRAVEEAVPGAAASLVAVEGDLYLVRPDGHAAWWPPIHARVEATTGIPLQAGGAPPRAFAALPGWRLAGVPVWSLPTPRTEGAITLFDGATVVWLLVLGALLVREYTGARREASQERDRQVARDTILQRLSHELRTPVASVRSLVDALDHPGTGEAERRQFLDLARSEAERLATGIDRLLQAARGTTVVRVDRVPLDLHEWAEGVRSRWLARLPGLVVEGTHPSPATADPERLDEAVDALLDNARKYGGPGVTLTVSPGRFSVEDDGEGIPAGDRDRVLKKFERMEGRVNDPGGHGLGLWAAGEVARAHGGRLTIEGPNRFVVTIP